MRQLSEDNHAWMVTFCFHCQESPNSDGRVVWLPTYQGTPFPRYEILMTAGCLLPMTRQLATAHMDIPLARLSAGTTIKTAWYVLLANSVLPKPFTN